MFPLFKPGLKAHVSAASGSERPVRSKKKLSHFGEVSHEVINRRVKEDPWRDHF
jgi:hypothetical protein